MIIDFAINWYVSLSLSFSVYVCIDVSTGTYGIYFTQASHVPVVSIDIRRRFLLTMEIIRNRIKIARIIGRRPLAFAVSTTSIRRIILFSTSFSLLPPPITTYRCPWNNCENVKSRRVQQPLPIDLILSCVSVINYSHSYFFFLFFFLLKFHPPYHSSSINF